MATGNGKEAQSGELSGGALKIALGEKTREASRLQDEVSALKNKCGELARKADESRNRQLYENASKDLEAKQAELVTAQAAVEEFRTKLAASEKERENMQNSFHTKLSEAATEKAQALEKARLSENDVKETHLLLKTTKGYISILKWSTALGFIATFLAIIAVYWTTSTFDARVTAAVGVTKEEFVNAKSDFDKKLADFTLQRKQGQEMVEKFQNEARKLLEHESSLMSEEGTTMRGGKGNVLVTGSTFSSLDEHDQSLAKLFVLSTLQQSKFVDVIINFMGGEEVQLQEEDLAKCLDDELGVEGRAFLEKKFGRFSMKMKVKINVPVPAEADPEGQFVLTFDKKFSIIEDFDDEPEGK